jgi:hypothetical protein
MATEPFKQAQAYGVPVSTMHTVSPGQHIGHISQMYGVPATDIMNHPKNKHLIAGGVLPTGSRIFIPRAGRPNTINATVT